MALRSNESLVERCHFLTFITEDIDQVKHIYVIAGALDAILILPTVVLNIVLIISLYRSPQLNTKPCTKLLYSLAVSDVLVGMVIEPVYLVKKVAELNHSFEVYCFTGMITYIGGWILGSTSFFNLTAIAVDRYLVVHSGTKYRTIVTNTRVTCLVLAIWTCVTSSCLTQLAIPKSTFFIGGAVAMTTGFAISSFCYIKIFKTLKEKKKISKSLVEKSTRQTAINSSRYNRSLSTMLYIFVIFLVCYLPFLGTLVSAGILGGSSTIWGAEALCSVVVYANSLINPIILFWRMKEIRHSASTTVSSSIPSGKFSLQIRKINRLKKGRETDTRNNPRKTIVDGCNR